MKKLLALLFLVFTLSLSAQQGVSSTLTASEPGAQVRAAFLRAYNAKNAEAVLALYAEDAILVSDGGTFKGRAEIRKWIQAALQQGSRLEAIEPDTERSSSTIAYGTGRSRRLVGDVVHLGQYLIVMEKQNGKWKIVQHFSLNVQ